MTSWAEFARQAPEFAAFGVARFQSGVAYLGTLRPDGGGGEFYVRGRATLTDDPAMRAEAVRAASYVPQERYILFILTIASAFMNHYVEGNPNIRRWPGPADHFSS
jgi:hypothetical protein